MKPVSLRSLAGALAAAALLAGNYAKAGYITGSINFDGSATTNNATLTSQNNLATATQYTAITAFALGIPTAGTGDYASVAEFTPVTFTPFSFTAGGVTPLWSFTSGGNTYTFDATSIHVTTQNATFLNVSGTGYAYLNGIDQTAGTWSITDTTQSSTVTFSSANTATASTPDGGATALLIVLGLVGISIGAYSKRRFTAAA